jgi:single-strand DNA-binding protein
VANVNKVILIGHIGRTPETKTLQSGSVVCNFSLATTSKWTKDGEKKEATQWHKIILWDTLAKVVQEYTGKGDPLYIEGRIEYRKYTDKDGNEKLITEIIGERVQLLKGKGQTNTEPEVGEPLDKSGDGLPF